MMISIENLLYRIKNIYIPRIVHTYPISNERFDLVNWHLTNLSQESAKQASENDISRVER